MANLTQSKCPHTHEAPLVYIPRDRNVIYHIFHDHFDSFIDHYEEEYAQDYGAYRLDRITEVVNKYLECGDYTQALARIACTNPKCDYQYFCPFSCKDFCFCPSAMYRDVQVQQRTWMCISCCRCTGMFKCRRSQRWREPAAGNEDG